MAQAVQRRKRKAPDTAWPAPTGVDAGAAVLQHHSHDMPPCEAKRARTRNGKPQVVPPPPPHEVPDPNAAPIQRQVTH